MATDNLTTDSVVERSDVNAAGNPAADVEPAGSASGAASAAEAMDLASVAAMDPDADGANLDMLMDVSLRVTVELGRARLKIRDILNLASGSVVQLEKMASEPVDIMVNGALLASGEVVVVDDQFAVRVTKLLNRVDRMKKLD